MAIDSKLLKGSGRKRRQALKRVNQAQWPALTACGLNPIPHAPSQISYSAISKESILVPLPLCHTDDNSLNSDFKAWHHFAIIPSDP